MLFYTSAAIVSFSQELGKANCSRTAQVGGWVLLAEAADKENGNGEGGSATERNDERMRGRLPARKQKPPTRVASPNCGEAEQSRQRTLGGAYPILLPPCRCVHVVSAAITQSPERGVFVGRVLAV